MAEHRVQRRLAAILAADMVGYSRLIEADEEATITRHRTHRTELIDLRIAEHNGRIVKTTGDGLLVEFASVVDAVRCAVEVQQAMVEREVDVPDDRRIQYRIGINLGDIVIEDDDVMGDGVNVAARLEALAKPGTVLISGTVFDQLKKKLEYGYAFEGERKVKNIAGPIRIYRVLPDSQAGTVSVSRRWSRKAWRRAVAVLLLAGLGVGWWRPWAPSVAPARPGAVLPLPNRPSIAVLPFTNLSREKEQEYFADGITEDLITDLSKVSGLFVIARNSTFTYKGKSVDVREVGRALGVRYVLEGSVRKAGTQVRINAQLVEATTGHHLWAERYDGEMKDIFTFQDKVTRRIVAALAVHLNAGEATRVSAPETQNATAYDAFLRGWQHYQRGSEADFRTAIRLFTQAVELDPGYGRAYGALALTVFEGRRRGFSSWVPQLPIIRSVATLDDDLLNAALRKPTSVSYRAASLIALWRGQPTEAVAHAQRALAIAPNDAQSHVAMADALVFSGDPKGGLSYIRKAMRLDPNYPAEYLRVMGLALFGLEKFGQAATHFERALELNPSDKFPAAALAAALGHLGRTADAASAIKIYRSQAAFGYSQTNPVQIMSKWPFNEPRDAERFGSGLLKAGLCCRRDLDTLIAALRARKSKKSQ